MKNILILLTALLLTSVELMAQSVPAGMRFQAVARDLEGSLLQEQQLEVLVELFATGADEKVFYSEKHQVLSSNLGLLDFIIGEGSSAKGKFSKIPWSKEEMWVRISVKIPEDKKYQIVSSGQLYSVPYAIYAETAGKLDSDSRVPGIGMNSINWTLEGNYDSQNRNNGNPVLGTTDANDLVIVTNNVPRIIIDKDGMINFLVDIDFDGSLNVDGATTLNGSLDVTNMASTHLTGTLVVDKATLLNDAVFVQNMAATAFTGSLDVDKTLNVDGTTTLNNTLGVTGMSATHLTGTLDVDKATLLNDAVSVQNMSATAFTGSLDVDKTLNVDGTTTLNNTLGVTGMSATHLTGTLDVDKATVLNDLTVENMAPTHLTGDLTVDGNIAAGTLTVNDAFEVADMAPTHLTGTLDVDKLATFEAGLQVNGEGTLEGNYLAFFDNHDGGNTDGIAIQLANNQINKDNNFMTFYSGESTVAGRVEGYSVGDMDEIPAPTNDEIWTAVCIGIADYNPITIAWTQMATGFNLFAAGWNNTTIPAFDIPDIPAFEITDVPALAIPDVPAFVITDVPSFEIPDIPGVEIPNLPGLTIGPLLCAEACFCFCGIDVTDWDCCCAEVCLIPTSFTVWPEIDIPDFPGIAIPDFPGIPIPDFPGIPIPDFPGIAIPDFPGLVIPAVPELDLSAVFGVCPTIPTFSDILIAEGICPDEDIFDLEDGYIRRLADWALEHRLQNMLTVDPLAFVAGALTWGLTTATLNNGTVFGSKGADYAEYLPKLYPTEQFMKGEVVGVHNGKISKSTTNADQILAITSQPLVLGNMPESGNTDDVEKVAFLGQIPVYVKGPVKMGDYIVPSGKNDGMAVAISPESMTARLLSSVLGTAWSDYDGDGITLINTSIGLRPMEIAEVLRKQSVVEEQLQEQMDIQRNSSDQLTTDIDLIKRVVYNR